MKDVNDSKKSEVRKESLFQLSGPSNFELAKATKPKVVASRTSFIQHTAETASVQPKNPIRRMLNPKQGEDPLPIKRGEAETQSSRRPSTDVSGHEARAKLLASLVDEKDACHYFLSKQSHKHQVKFLHLVPVDGGYRGYCPYEMKVVSESLAEEAPMHYMMTDTALTTIKKEVDPDTGAVVRILDALTLADWIHEKDTFNVLRKRCVFFFFLLLICVDIKKKRSTRLWTLISDTYHH